MSILKVYITLLLWLIVGAVSAQIPSGLIAYYPFNGNVNDSTGIGGNGTLVNGPLPYGCGVAGEAAYFDGSGVHILLNGAINNHFNNNADYSIAFFAKNSNSPLKQQVILDKRITCTPFDDGLNIRINYPYPSLTMEFITLGASYPTKVPFDSLDCWFHFAITKKGDTVKIYRDAVLVLTNLLPSGHSYSNSVNLTIGDGRCVGTRDGTKFLESPIDEMMFFDRPISAAEVVGLYNLFIDQTPNAVVTDTICQGDSVMVSYPPIICQADINWVPTTGVSNPTGLSTYLSPTTSTTYMLIQNGAGPICADTHIVNIIVDPCLICDTLYLNDTVVLNSTVTIDTLFVNVQDTLYVIDTTVLPVTVTDTFYVVDTLVIDSLFISGSDTLTIRDTTVLPVTINDTIYRNDTLTIDTLYLSVRDTLTITDTTCADTVFVNTVDPLLPADTVLLIDTIVYYDTIATLDSTIYIPFDVYLQISNAFTPNGDGIGDLWGITGTGFTVIELTVWDNNTLVFQRPPGVLWDGTLNGNAMPAGTYTFEAELRVDRNGVIFYRTGTIQLIR